MDDPRPLLAIVLAAGRGTRMGAAGAKALLDLVGMPLVGWVLEAIDPLPLERAFVVVGHGRREMEAYLGAFSTATPIETVVQEPQLGTGDAVSRVRPFFRDRGGDVLVLYGDCPLIRTETLQALRRRHRETGADATLVSAVLDRPRGSGRILRDGRGRFLGIREERDASPAERAIREVNAGVYVFRSGRLFQALGRVGRDNAQGEYYLTDAVVEVAALGGRVEVLELASDIEQLLGANTPEELHRLRVLARWRLLDRFRSLGVDIVDPASTCIEKGAEIGAGTRLEPGTVIRSGARLGAGCHVGPSVVIGRGARIPDGERVGPGPEGAGSSA